MKLALLFLLAIPAFANTCTPLSVAVNGPFPAIVGGIDELSYSSVRVQWTSDQSPSAATQQRIQYSTATEYAITGPAYAHLTSQTSFTTASSSAVQVGILSNLIPGIVYHFMPQSFQGGAWCTISDATFTTTGKPANLAPGLPSTVNTTRPTISGTDWAYGSTCGTTGTITQKIQNCIDGSGTPSHTVAPGDGIGIPGGTYPILQVTIPPSPNQVAITCSTGTNACTQSGSAPADGTQMILGGAGQFGSAPSPINPGVPYYVVGSSGSTFQLSYTNSGSPITLLNAGSTVAYLPWPITQPKIVVHSTASASLLPPVGVRLGPDALTQYLPNMPVIISTDPLHGAFYDSTIIFSQLAANYTFENVGFSVDSTVATSTAASSDPIGFAAPLQLPLSVQNIIFDQCAFTQPPPPTRVASIDFNGFGNAVVNSYLQWDDWWLPAVINPTGTYPTISGNVITFPAYTWSYIGSSGAKVSCAEPAGTLTITGGGSGSMLIWTNPNCTMTAQLTTGVTASTTITGLTVTNTGTPAYPTYTYTAPGGATLDHYAAMPFNYTFTISSGTLTDTTTSILNNWIYPGSDGGLLDGRLEGATGVEISYAGPFKFDNNYFIGSAIGGIFWTDGITLGTTPCGSTNPCSMQVVMGNLTVTRNTMTTDTTHFNYDSPSWDGGNRYWRNVNEQKVGRYSLWDGNIIGPWYGQVGEGNCGLHEEFTNQWLLPNVPAYASSSDWTYTNNTCLGPIATALTSAYSFQGGPIGYPIKNFLVQNNLFYNNNAYTNVPQNQPVAAHYTPVTYPGSCPQGQFASLVQGENFIFDHNTISGLGGCQSFGLYLNSDYSSMAVTNNFLNYLQDPIVGQTAQWAFFNAQGYLSGTCSTAATASAIFGCINDFTFKGNAMLGTWSNSLAFTDLTSAQLSTAQSSYFSGYTASWPGISPYTTANTLALRQGQVKWFSVSAANFRLASSSPFISGNQGTQPSPTTDGLDVGANIDQLEQHQGKVSNVRIFNGTTGVVVGFYGPDAIGCPIDIGTTAFYNGGGTWTRVADSGGDRVHNVVVNSLMSATTYFYRISCQVMQPTGTFTTK